MNTNQNIQYQSLLNRNIGTNMECDEMLVDDITCINLTSSGTITGNVINATTVTISGKLTATNDVDSIVSNSNTIAVYGISTGNYIIPLVSDSGGSGFRSLYNDISLMYNATNDTITCGKATFTLGDWSTDTPTLVLGDFGTNQGIIQLIGDATKSIFIECSSTGNLEIYQKVGGTLTLLHTLTSTTATYDTDMNVSTGHMYKINNVNVDTDDITSVGATNKYLNSLTATLPLLYNTGTNIVSISSTGNISVATIVTTGRSEFLNGNNVQGTNYSAYFGTSNSKSGQIVIWDGLASNQYTQLACRSNVFIVQGNITSISLEKNTNITGTLNATTGVNISTGQTYKINSVAQTFLNNLTTTPTTTITHTFASPNLQSNINALSITDGLITNNTITLSKINTGAYNQIGSADVLAQYNATGGLNPTYIETQSGFGTANFFYSPGTSSTSIGSIIPTVVIGEEYVNSGVIRIDSNGADKAYIHILNNDLYIETTNSVGSTINIGKGTNTSTTIRDLTVTANVSAVGVSCTTLTSTSNILTTAGYLQSLIGVSDIITPSSSTGSLLVGLSSLNNGVIKISSASGAIATFGTTIQQNSGNLYIDNTGTTSINIGTVITTNTVNIGSAFNLVSKVPTFNGGRFNNISVKEFSNMQHTDSIVITNWTAIGNTATTDPFQSSIIPRSSFSQIRVTVNIALNNWGTALSNRHLSLRRSTSAMTYGTTYATESVSSSYGINHILSGVQYQSANFTWIDRTANTAGTTYYYCVVARSSTAATVSENLGNNAFCDLHLEELY